MSTRLASNHLTCWPIYGLKYCMDFSIDLLNPCATTPSQAIRTIPIAYQLQPELQKQLHRCVHFGDVVAWICVVLWLGIHGFIARTWNVTLLSGTSSYVLQENSFCSGPGLIDTWGRVPIITFSVRKSKYIPLLFFFSLSSKCLAKSRKYHHIRNTCQTIRGHIFACKLFGALPPTSFQLI